MYKGKKISVVAPAYNEERLIGPTLDNVPWDIVDHFYVVDDASTDTMPQVVRERAKTNPRIELLRHERNSGVGQAIITGYLKSSADGYDVTVVIGGDNQMDLGEITRFLDPIIAGEADYVKGNRFLLGGNAYTDMPITRFVGNLFFTFLTKFASGYWKIYDVVDGYAAISKDAIDRVDWKQAWKGYGYVCDWPAVFNLYKLRIKDVPRRAIYLKGERQSQIKGFRYVMRMTPKLIYRFFWRMVHKYMLHDFHPLVFFYLFGLLLLPAGLILGIYVFYMAWIGPAPINLAILCTLLILSGMQLLLFGMLFDMQDNEKLCV